MVSTTVVPEDILPLKWSCRIVEHDETGCWLWIGAWGASEYGVINFRGGNTTAHRAIYQFVTGEFLGSEVVDHLCKVHPCVNPSHLQAVSQTENLLRGDTGKVQQARHAAKTHCKNKHLLSGDNVHNTFSKGYPERVCRTCVRERMRGYRAAKRANA